MNAVKMSKGRWRARGYNKATKTQKYFWATTKSEAERLARAYQESSKDASAFTFGEAYDLYIKAHPQWSPTTKKKYKGWINTAFKDLVDIKLDLITDTMLQQMLDEWASRLSAKTVVNMFSPIRAVMVRYRPRNPIYVVKPTKVKPKLVLPSQADVELLMATAQGSRYYTAILLACFGCMRLGEIMALDMDHIDLDSRKIFIEHSMTIGEDNKPLLKCPKNGHTRTIQVPQLVIDAIKKEGLPVGKPNTFSASYGKYIKRNSLPAIRFHSLRHYCAARMLSMNPNPIPISVVQQYGGWLDVRTLMEIYNYCIDEVNESSMNAWNNFANETSQKLVRENENP